MAIIAISREMGSCGSTIAAAVAKALNYDYVDRQMIVNAAEANVVDAAIAEVAEPSLSAWQRFNEEKIRYRAFLDTDHFVATSASTRLVRNLSLAARVHCRRIPGVSRSCHAIRP